MFLIERLENNMFLIIVCILLSICNLINFLIARDKYEKIVWAIAELISIIALIVFFFV